MKCTKFLEKGINSIETQISCCVITIEMSASWYNYALNGKINWKGEKGQSG